jgi:LacI family transcriptional regulator
MAQTTRKTRPSSVQKTIAAQIGVSQAIVSHIISGRRPVSTPLHARIVEEWKRLGYQTNLAARALRTGRTQSLALVLPDFSYLADFNRSIVQGMWEVARPRHQSLIVTSMNEPHAEPQDYLRIARQKQVDGMFFMQEHDLERIDFNELRRAGIPAVFVNGISPDARSNGVSMDGAAGVKRAVDHLIHAHAKRRIAWVCHDPSSPLMADRYHGYVQALQDASIEFDPKLVFPAIADAEYEVQGVEGAKHLLKSGLDFDAVACATDYTAMGLINTLRRAGIETGRDVAVVGFDNLRHAAHFHPTLTTVACDGRKMGHLAMQMMFDLLEQERRDRDGSELKGLRQTVQTTLVVRHSCGCGDDQDAGTA